MYYTNQEVNNKGADQTARMRRLICAFVVRIWQNRFSHDGALTYINAYVLSPAIPKVQMGVAADQVFLSLYSGFATIVSFFLTPFLLQTTGELWSNWRALGILMFYIEGLPRGDAASACCETSLKNSAVLALVNSVPQMHQSFLLLFLTIFGVCRLIWAVAVRSCLLIMFFYVPFHLHWFNLFYCRWREGYSMTSRLEMAIPYRITLAWCNISLGCLSAIADAGPSGQPDSYQHVRSDFSFPSDTIFTRLTMYH